jgi:hypothetical protein
MASYHNIEKNRLHKNRWIGYAAGRVYRIDEYSGEYHATLNNPTREDRDLHFSSRTLGGLSKRLDAIAAEILRGSRESNPSQRTADDLIVAMHPFKASALTGDSDKRHRGTGRLSREAATLFLDAEPGPHGTGAWFVVSSYATPIAWYTATGGWCVIDKSALDGGSVTTSKHINLVKRALGLR